MTRRSQRTSQYVHSMYVSEAFGFVGSSEGAGDRVSCTASYWTVHIVQDMKSEGLKAGEDFHGKIQAKAMI